MKNSTKTFVFAILTLLCGSVYFFLDSQPTYAQTKRQLPTVKYTVIKEGGHSVMVITNNTETAITAVKLD